MAKTPNYIMQILRQVNGFEADETTLDAEFEALSPVEKLTKMFQWHLGYDQWADYMIKWWRDAQRTDVIPPYFLAILRKRDNLEPDDSSNDDKYMKYSALEKMDEITAWELGDPRWVKSFFGWANDCGVDLNTPLAG